MTEDNALVIDYTVHQAADDQSVQEHFNLEQLATDPELTCAGRLWFNTTENRLKISVLAADGRSFIGQDVAQLPDIQTTINNTIAAGVDGGEF